MVVTKRDLFVLSAAIAHLDLGVIEDESALDGLNDWFFQDNVQQLVIPWRDGLYAKAVDDVRGDVIQRKEVERLYAVRDALAEGIKPPPAGNPWPGVVKAYLSGDVHARLALADLFGEAGDQAQAEGLRVAAVPLYMATWSDDYDFVEQIGDMGDVDLTVREMDPNERRTRAKDLVDEYLFHTPLQRDAFAEGIPVRGQYADAMWSQTEGTVVADVLRDIDRILGETD